MTYRLYKQENLDFKFLESETDIYELVRWYVRNKHRFSSFQLWLMEVDCNVVKSFERSSYREEFKGL